MLCVQRRHDEHRELYYADFKTVKKCLDQTVVKDKVDEWQPQLLRLCISQGQQNVISAIKLGKRSFQCKLTIRDVGYQSLF